MRRQLSLAALLIGATLALMAGCKPRELNAEEARQLLAEVRQARGQVALKGQVSTHVRLADTQVQAEATVHRGDGRFQLEFISGEVKGVKIIEQDRGVWQMAADGKAVRHLPRNPVDQMPFMGRNAVVQTSSGGQLAGRATDKIVIRPQPDAVARLEMWVDRETRFPLGFDRYNNEDMLVASTRYTSVDFSVAAPPLAELPAATEEVAEEPRGERIEKEKAAELLERAPLEPTYLPEGFAFQGYFLHERGRGPAVELRYSDGVRLVSVLQFKAGERGEGRGGRPRGGGPGQMGERRGPGEGPPGDERGERPRRMRDGDPGGEEGERPRRMRDGRDAGEDVDRPREGRRGGGRSEGQFAEGERGPVGREGVREGRGPEGGMMRSVLRGRIVRFRAEGLAVVVAGEISEDELNKVADSMRPISTSF